jgi:class 3 adenylate cyclase
MTTLDEANALEARGETLKPYVPRLLIEWVRETPDASYRAVDGSLAFVDISGFTALTERLARRGKIGAELLRDTLDGVFRALLDEAYLWGAGLLKWGGDALLLLFDGPGHQARAARAAWEMQRVIERVGRIRVGGGTVTLRMSIGITSGTIDFFTAGSVHRELLVVGPTATETAVIEGVADAGEIGISHALARHLDPSCIGPVKEDALLLAAPPDAEQAPAPDVGAVSGVEVAACIPIAAREHVLLEHSEPEHRTITAAFFDLMQTDVLLAKLGPTAFAEALDERICAIQEAATRFEVPFNVTDVSKGSVKVLLTAGAPSTTGHDEEQTLRLAREVMERPGVIPMRMGINTGRVFTGDFGPPYRRAYTVLGDAINTAARVMARAEAGQILATEIVLERSRTTFATTPIEPFQAKGKAELVKASIVGEIAGRRPERVAETPFVGRERELKVLRAVLDEVKAGKAWTIEVAGPSGIGKTRLIRELLEATPDVRVLQATCEEYEAARFLD